MEEFRRKARKDLEDLKQEVAQPFRDMPKPEGWVGVVVVLGILLALGTKLAGFW